MAKQTVFTQTDKAIVSALKGAADGLTLAELNEVTGMEIKSGHVVGAAKKGLIEVIGEREVERPAKRKVATYVALNKERMSSGSINGLVKKGNITKGENDREIATIAKSSVNVYGFVKDIPADAEIR